MRSRPFAVLILSTLLAGCATQDRIITSLGLPERGFLTNAVFSESAPPQREAANGCTASGCPQAPRFCLARGYQPGSDSYGRCIASVEQNLRRH